MSNVERFPPLESLRQRDRRMARERRMRWLTAAGWWLTTHVMALVLGTVIGSQVQMALDRRAEAVKAELPRPAPMNCKALLRQCAAQGWKS